MKNNIIKISTNNPLAGVEANSFVEYFECGKYYSVNQKEAGHFVVNKLSDISEKILPFFNKYEIIGEKRHDFIAFCRAAELIKAKKHLTQEGYEEILKIKAEMNKYDNINLQLLL